MKIVKQCEHPKLLVITPLRLSDKISDKTLSSISNNKVPFTWISFSGEGNPYKNFDLGLKIYEMNYSLPDYIIKMDNDIIAKDGMLDKMVACLDGSSENVGYAYCAFRFTGAIEVSFGARPFNRVDLTKYNYISSISMMKTEILKKIGFVING
jgi:cellulose synthase/poly-beta-1,6-N-acetylglucosamine synthase-like glycosyltransferase